MTRGGNARSIPFLADGEWWFGLSLKERFDPTLTKLVGPRTIDKSVLWFGYEGDKIGGRESIRRSVWFYCGAKGKRSCALRYRRNHCPNLFASTNKMTTS